MYFVVDMPLNEDGNGPEMNSEKVTYTLYEIWDLNFEAVAAFRYKDEAEEYCEELILKWINEGMTT